MRKILTILLLLPFAAISQTKTVIPVGSKNQIIVNGSTASDSVAYMPSGCGSPTINMSNYISKKRGSAVYIDTCTNNLYYYNPGTGLWSYVTSSSVIIGSNKTYQFQDSTNTPPSVFPVGLDTLYWLVAGTPTGAWAGKPYYIARYVNEVLDSLVIPVSGDVGLVLTGAAKNTWHQYNGVTWPRRNDFSWSTTLNIGGGLFGSSNSQPVYMQFNSQNRIILQNNGTRFAQMGGTNTGLTQFNAQGLLLRTEPGASVDTTTYKPLGYSSTGVPKRMNSWGFGSSSLQSVLASNPDITTDHSSNFHQKYWTIDSASLLDFKSASGYHMKLTSNDTPITGDVGAGIGYVSVSEDTSIFAGIINIPSARYATINAFSASGSIASQVKADVDGSVTFNSTTAGYKLTTLPTLGASNYSTLVIDTSDGSIKRVNASGTGFLIATNNLSDVGNTGTSLTNLGGTTAGKNFFTLTNPSAITFARINADNTIDALDAATFRTAIGAGTGAGSITALTGDLTASGSGSVAATLATVNSNVGSFGSSTQTGTFTVNGKGLITAASNVTITTAVGSVTGLGAGVATALGVNVGSAGAFTTFNGAGGTPSSVTLTNGTGLPESGVTNLTSDLALKAALAGPTFTGTVTIPTPFTIGAVSMTATGTQLNYLNQATGVTGTLTSNVVLSGAPAFTGTMTNTGGFVMNGSSLLFRTTNAGSNISAQSLIDIDGSNSVAGSQAVAFETASGLVFTAANGTRRIARGAIKLTSLTNTAGSEAGTLSFYTQTAGAAMAENMKLSGAGNLTIGAANNIVGTATNNNAATGNIGEEINSTVSTYTNYTTTATYQNVTSITLTAGDWDLSAFFTYSSNSATITAASNAIFVISTTTASAAGATEGQNIDYVPQAALLGTSKFSDGITAFRVSLSGTTTYYLNSQATFTLGNPQFVGSIRARRIR